MLNSRDRYWADAVSGDAPRDLPCYVAARLARGSRSRQRVMWGGRPETVWWGKNRTALRASITRPSGPSPYAATSSFTISGSASPAFASTTSSK